VGLFVLDKSLANHVQSPVFITAEALPVIKNYHHDAPVISLLLVLIDYYARKFLVD
jgi:hypothetical protein